MVSGNLFSMNLRRLNFDHGNIVLNSKALFFRLGAYSQGTLKFNVLQRSSGFKKS